MSIKSSSLKDVYFFVLMIVLLGAMIYIFAPFFSVIIIAFILVEFFYPLYRQLHKHTNSWLASGLSTIIAILTVVVPILIILVIAAGEAINLGSHLQQSLAQSGLLDGNGQMLNDKIAVILKALNISSQQLLDSGNNFVVQAGGQIGQLIYSIISGLINNVANLLVTAFLMIFTMLYLFKDYENLGTRLKQLSPFPDELDELFFKKFKATSRAVIKGSLVIALLQASAVTIAIAILGIGSPILWWIIMVLLSIIPVGSGLIWFPLGILLMISGRPVEGIFLMIYSAIIINVIDTTLRPLLIKGGTNLHPIIALFSALGGLGAFGLIGLLYGPLIAVFFITVLDVYRKRFHTNTEQL